MNAVTVELQDSRRLTGPNLLADGPGAVIDGSVQGVAVDTFATAWRARAREALDAVGWAGESTAERPYEGGVTVFFSAPIDALYAATEVNEWAWAAASADVGAGPNEDAASEVEPLAQAASRLQEMIEAERNPALLALQAAARERGMTFLWDDEQASVGTGTGSRTWNVDELPGPREVRWDEIHDVPRVLVTGTNGKTTTVRMLAAIAGASGRTTGFTCTDGIYVDGKVVDAGDWSGPGGARALLRNRRVEVAILETARGGMLRRGLAVDQADGALVTNVAADHLGEWGVVTVDDVAAAKLMVAKAVRHGAPLVVNADDSHLSRIARGRPHPPTWIAVDEVERVRAELGPEDVAWILEEGWLSRVRGAATGTSGKAGVPERVVEASAIPATLGGAAAFNVSNALGAAALAEALGLPDEAIRSGLVGFDPSPESSPGRGNLFDVGGVQVMVDFVHNPHGFEAMARTVKRIAPERVGLMIGQAGDRDDESIRAFVRAAWRLEPHRVAIKKMSGYERGREPGEASEIILAELNSLGAPPDVVSTHEDEVEAARALLEWARAGDFVLLSSQSHRTAVIELVRGMVG